MRISSVIKSLLAVTAVAVPVLAQAESNVVTGTTNAPGAQAHVDFQIVIPKVLYLRVGTGSTYTGATPSLANDTTINLVQFSPAAGQVGNGSAVTTVGGDLTAGSVTAAIVSNSGNVSLSASSGGALNDGVAADTISYTQIKTAFVALTATATLLTAPVLADGASNTVLLTAPATKIILADAKWTYTYANTVNPPAGTYGGAGIQNGRVTYTASMP